jgi:hypothetical protein
VNKARTFPVNRLALALLELMVCVFKKILLNFESCDISPNKIFSLSPLRFSSNGRFRIEREILHKLHYFFSYLFGFKYDWGNQQKLIFYTQSSHLKSYPHKLEHWNCVRSWVLGQLKISQVRHSMWKYPRIFKFSTIGPRISTSFFPRILLLN